MRLMPYLTALLLGALTVPAAALELKALKDRPLSFEPESGTDIEGAFRARGEGYLLRVSPSGAELNLKGKQGWTRLEMVLQGAKARQGRGLKAQVGRSHYLLGADPAKWRRDVPQYARVHYEGVYQGIDLQYYGIQRRLEYDFVVAPGADWRSIEWQVKGAREVSVGPDGSLLLLAEGGEVRFRPPHTYLSSDPARSLPSRYELRGRDRVGFAVDGHDGREAIVIDPILDYATYLGGASNDYGYAVAVDAAGYVYVGGQAAWPFPTTPGALQTSPNGMNEIFVSKLSADLSTLVYSTYVGGTGQDNLRGMAVDALGRVVFVGGTDGGYPTTAGAFRTVAVSLEALVTMLSADGGSLVFSTYLGGSGSESASDLALDPDGNILVAGTTSSTNFPGTAGTAQPANAGNNDGFVAKLNAGGASLAWATYIGGSGGDDANGVAVDLSGNAYVTGTIAAGTVPSGTAGALATSYRGGSFDAFMAKLDTAGAYLWFSYLGGSGSDYGNGVALDAQARVYVTGATSGSFPVTAGAYRTTTVGSQEAFVARFDSLGTSLDYATYLASAGIDTGRRVAVVEGDKACVTGVAYDWFPMTAGSYGFGGSRDAFVSKLGSSGSTLEFSTHLGGGNGDDGYALAVAPSGRVYVTGYTTAPGVFPSTAAAYQTSTAGSSDAFIVALMPVAPTSTPSTTFSPTQSPTFSTSPTPSPSLTETPTPSPTITPTPAPTARTQPFTDDFSTDQGWTYAGEWERGPATASCCQTAGNADPAEDHSPSGDGRLAGTVIGGNIAKVTHPLQYLESPAVDLSATSAPQLRFWRWLNTDQNGWHNNSVEAWDGTQWVTLFTGQGTDSAWVEKVYDLTPYKNAALKVRIGSGVGFLAGLWDASGWNVDDVYIGEEYHSPTPTPTGTPSATPTPSPTPFSGRWVVALQSTDEDFLRFGPMPAFTSGDWSIVARLQVPTWAAFNPAGDGGHGSGDGGYAIDRGRGWNDQNGDFGLSIGSSGFYSRRFNGGWTSVSHAHSVAKGEWHAYAWTCSSGLLRYYVDGVELASWAVGQPNDNGNSNYHVLGGQDNPSYADGRGRLVAESDIVIAHEGWVARALSPAEVAAYATDSGGVSASDPDVRLWTSIGNGVVSDLSGHAPNAEIGNSPVFYQDWGSGQPPAGSPTNTPSFTASPTLSASCTVTPIPSPTSTATPSATPSASPTDSPTVTPSATATPTASPTQTPTSTATGTPSLSPTGTPTPNLTQTSIALSWTPTPPYPRNELGLSVVAGPVPARRGQPLCLYFGQAPKGGGVELYNLAGEKVASAAFGLADLPCLQTGGFAPGIYFLRLKSGEETRWQKVAIVE